MKFKTTVVVVPALALAGLLGLSGKEKEREETVVRAPIPALPAVVIEEKVKEEQAKKEQEIKDYSHISLKDLPIKERKKRFIEIMLPLIEKANREVLKERAFILRVADKGELSPQEEERLRELKKKYRAETINELLEKVNAVPPGLVLAQAVLESGWGTSRFFKEANNAFGIYTFKEKKCLKAKGYNFCVRKYPSLYASVKDYIYNLNVGWAYKEFRRLRNKGADIYTLTKSLVKYSELKDEYTQLVNGVIKKNGFDSIGSPVVAARSPSTR